MNFSNSTTDKTESLKNANLLAHQWETINWTKVEIDVNRLQTRIAKAMANGERNKAKRLQYLLTHSFSAKAFAVRKVTTNKGKVTSGVDKKLWSTSSAKMKAVLTLTDRGYRSKPLKRVYISKKGKNKKRPLGIPTMYDRAMQTLYALALEPIAEIKADKISFGFRRGRSAKDACEQIFALLARKCSPTWILEGDIKGCFDNINHDWLQSNIPMDKES
jgi:RNA-directed DNA polymerase (EC 2.7.7.49)